MEITTYHNAVSFLKRAHIPLESNEAGNCLILGVCQRLASQPEDPINPPCLKTVEAGDSLIIVAMMTPPHKLVIYGHQGDLLAGIGALADDMLAEGWHVPGVLGPGDPPLHFVERWKAITRKQYALERKMSAYALRKVNQVDYQTGRLRLAAKSDSELLAAWWYAFHQEIFGKGDKEEALNATHHHIIQRDLYLWDNGQPVSMAMTTRPTRNGISISAVYTPPEFRGQGYATACVGALSQLLLDRGWKYVALFADTVNIPANHVYQKIGFKPVSAYSEFVIYN